MGLDVRSVDAVGRFNEKVSKAMAEPFRFESLKEFFQKGYDAGGIFENDEYTFSEDDWGYVHKRMGITVWADPLDLREGDDYGEAEVLFHYTTALGYRNITNESKEKVEVWASLVTQGLGANAYWGKGVYTVPKPPDEWRDPEELLDNNYRSMMKCLAFQHQCRQQFGERNRLISVSFAFFLIATCDLRRDSEQHGADYVEREYPPRVAFCIPIVVNSEMAFDVSVRQTPEMKRYGKPPGENLAGILLNPPGLPPRVCVVVTRMESPHQPLQEPRLSGRHSRNLNASASLLERVQRRAQAVADQLGPNAPEAMRTQFRLAVVFFESGYYWEALETLKGELKRRRAILGKEHIDSFRAMWRFGQILMSLGHFKDAQESWLSTLPFKHGFVLETNWRMFSSTGAAEDCQLEVLRNLPRMSSNAEEVAQFERERLRSLASLGAIFSLQHQMRYAEPLFLEAYSGRRASLGPMHFDTLEFTTGRKLLTSLSTHLLALVSDILMSCSPVLSFSSVRHRQSPAPSTAVL